MDLNTVRSIITVLMTIAFVGIVAWAYSKRSKPRFDEAAMLPFADEAIAEHSALTRERR